MRILMLLFLFVSCGYKFNTNTNEELALGTTTCITSTFELERYCKNVYSGYETCYRGNLEIQVACEEYEMFKQRNNL